MPKSQTGFILCFLALASLELPAGTPVPGFTEVVVASGLSSPTAMAFSPDGRIFVCEQGGALRVIKNNALLATPFVTVSTDPSGERGLLGVTFDPDFAVNNYVYVYYTVPSSPRFNRVSRFTANGDVAVSGSELILLNLNNLTTATNHNGGALHFGPDGKLYIAVGENATTANAQSLSNLLGKILRMNADGSIPADNPTSISGISGSPTGQNRLIWAAGLRNPFTFAFDPVTGRMFINDVGQNTWEEVNVGRAGANYGWPSTEGATTDLNFGTPYFAYAHGGAAPTGCAISGGVFYNPTNPTYPPAMAGQYFFADFCSGWIYRIAPTGAPSPTQFLTGAVNPVDVRVGPDARIYYLERGNGGRVLRIDNTNSNAPSITQHPQNTQVSAGQPATFSVTATGPSLTYQWQRNSQNINGATNSTYTFTPQLADNGAVFRVIVQNTNGTATSNPAVLTVVSNQPPTATITSPVQGTLFSGGDTIVFNGAGTDQNSNPINPATFVWRVDYITGAAVRPFVLPFTGASGSFTVPAITPYLLTDVHFLIYLTVRDGAGLETTVSRRVDPRVSQITVTSIPAGRQLTLDGVPFTAPQVVNSVVGLLRPIGAPSPQTNGGTRDVFASWSDGGAATHDITVPITNATYTATFNREHLLTTIANPSQGGTVSSGGWFSAGSTQSVTATPSPGWVFSGFTGALSGTTSPQNVLMDGPKTVTANFTALAPFLVLQTTAKADGPQPGQRLWTLRLNNTGQGPALNARITSVAISPVGGQGNVTLLSPLPILFGDIGPGSSATATMLLNFPLTQPVTRVRITYTVVADGGYTNTITFNNQFR
ncbi:MAG: PQQ-dependent sugar dehydrogenase [Bryobacterales bacterium]|nr:PQQ-dependent sugar dehydrogenase [Bryobacterales bacterium]